MGQANEVGSTSIDGGFSILQLCATLGTGYTSHTSIKVHLYVKMSCNTFDASAHYLQFILALIWIRHSSFVV